MGAEAGFFRAEWKHGIGCWEHKPTLEHGYSVVATDSGYAASL